MNIYALPSHQTKERTSGVDYARIISPMKNLNGYKGIKTTLYDVINDEKHNDPTDWFEVMKNNDIFFFNYLNNPWGFAAMGVVARKEGVKLVMDIDDSLWDIHSDNPAYEAWRKGSVGIKNFTSICNEVDYITCTSEYLKHVIMNNTNKTPDKIKVIPNYIDFKIYKHRTTPNNIEKIVLSHFGSTTHFKDLDDHDFFKGVDKIMKEYPQVEFQTIGAFIPKFRKAWGQRYKNVYGHQDIYQWVDTKFPQFMQETDILLTPLTDDIYNRCKSQIKWLEASSAQKVGVWQDIRQYAEVVDGTNGILADSNKKWYRGIKYLIDNPDKRNKAGQKAYEDVKNWDIEKHLDEYSDFFKLILDK